MIDLSERRVREHRTPGVRQSAVCGRYPLTVQQFGGFAGQKSRSKILLTTFQATLVRFTIFRGVAQLGRALRSGASNRWSASFCRLRQISLDSITIRRFCRTKISVKNPLDHFSDHIGHIHHISRRGSAW